MQIKENNIMTKKEILSEEVIDDLVGSESDILDNLEDSERLDAVQDVIDSIDETHEQEKDSQNEVSADADTSSDSCDGRSDRKNSESSESSEENQSIKKPVKDDSKLKYVEAIRVYSYPCADQPGRLFSGNIKVIGEVGPWTTIEYVRAGFGVAIGYTNQI